MCHREDVTGCAFNLVCWEISARPSSNLTLFRQRWPSLILPAHHCIAGTRGSRARWLCGPCAHTLPKQKPASDDKIMTDNRCLPWVATRVCSLALSHVCVTVFSTLLSPDVKKKTQTNQPTTPWKQKEHKLKWLYERPWMVYLFSQEKCYQNIININLFGWGWDGLELGWREGEC